MASLFGVNGGKINKYAQQKKMFKAKYGYHTFCTDPNIEYVYN